MFGDVSCSGPVKKQQPTAKWWINLKESIRITNNPMVELLMVLYSRQRRREEIQWTITSLLATALIKVPRDAASVSTTITRKPWAKSSWRDGLFEDRRRRGIICKIESLFICYLFPSLRCEKPLSLAWKLQFVNHTLVCANVPREQLIESAIGKEDETELKCGHGEENSKDHMRNSTRMTFNL